MKSLNGNVFGDIVEVGRHQRGMLEELEKAHIYIQRLHDRLKRLEAQLELQP